MKKGISITLIILLSISLITVLFIYNRLLEESNLKQNNVNIEVKEDLSVASASFLGNSLTNETGKEFNYHRAMTMIASASQLFAYTTYNENNKNLLTILNNLCNLMENDECKAIVIEKSNSIYVSLSQLSMNPEDKKATDNLSKVVDEIRQNR